MSAVYQITVRDVLTRAKVSYYVGFPARNGICPNYFWITPEGRLAQVFIELCEDFKGNRCYAKICDGINGAIFDPANTVVECNGVSTQYKPNTVFNFDIPNKKFKFEDVGATKMVDWTSRFRRRVIIGVRNDKKSNAEILSPVDSPMYVPFALNGALIPNTYYFGTWGKTCLSVYIKYYMFDMSDNTFTVHIKPFISTDICKSLDKRYINAIVQVKDEKGKVILQRYYNKNSEFSVAIQDSNSNKVVFSERTVANGFFQQDEDFMLECKDNGITFYKGY